MPLYHPRSRHLKQLYKKFAFLIFLTVAICVVFQMMGPSDIIPPAYVPIKTYITSECADGRRLGNLMFNYASLVGIGLMYNMTPVMNMNFRLFNIFNISAVKTANMENTLGLHREYEEYGRRACAYDHKIKKLTKVNTRLHGYFQSWKYFNGSESEIHKQFVFHDNILAPAKDFIERAKVQVPNDNKWIRVGIHVRRGDYLDGYYANYGYTTATVDYFQKAMEYFTDKFENVQFVVCSDDIGWCKENILGRNVVYSESGSDVIDLAILSQCDHTIMSTGSFGWWGAFLANGTTIYYDNWPKPVSILEYMVTKPDFFYPHWIPMR